MATFLFHLQYPKVATLLKDAEVYNDDGERVNRTYLEVPETDEAYIVPLGRLMAEWLRTLAEGRVVEEGEVTEDDILAAAVTPGLGAGAGDAGAGAGAGAGGGVAPGDVAVTVERQVVAEAAEAAAATAAEVKREIEERKAASGVDTGVLVTPGLDVASAAGPVTVGTVDGVASETGATPPAPAVDADAASGVAATPRSRSSRADTATEGAVGATAASDGEKKVASVVDIFPDKFPEHKESERKSAEAKMPSLADQAKAIALANKPVEPSDDSAPDSRRVVSPIHNLTIVEGRSIQQISRVAPEGPHATGAMDEGEADMMVVTFRVMTVAVAEDLLTTLLEEIGIGSSMFPEFGSVSVTKCELSRPDLSHTIMENADKFWASVKTKISVDQLVSSIYASAQFSFDYLMLVIVAGLLAGVGLATNNTVVIVASMLVSPLMGPILAITFGSYVRDWKLVSIGLWSEAAGLLACVVTGVVVGLCFAVWGPVLGWPTNEMASRGVPSGLVVGITIAVPSGVGVALAVMGSNTSGLVGVAISASLLPPAVNCGMFWAYALIGKALTGADLDGETMVEAGAISFALTIVNIVCIIIVAWGMCKIKEVAPIKGKNVLFQPEFKEELAYLNGHKATTELEADIREMGAVSEVDPAATVGFHGTSMINRAPAVRPHLFDIFPASTPEKHPADEHKDSSPESVSTPVAHVKFQLRQRVARASSSRTVLQQQLAAERQHVAQERSPGAIKLPSHPPRFGRNSSSPGARYTSVRMGHHTLPAGMRPVDLHIGGRHGGRPTRRSAPML